MSLRAVPSVLLLGFLVTGCPEVRGVAPTSECKQAYEKCKLPEGPLGVCDRRVCKAGETEPCLVCVSQH